MDVEIYRKNHLQRVSSTEIQKKYRMEISKQIEEKMKQRAEIRLEEL